MVLFLEYWDSNAGPLLCYARTILSNFILSFSQAIEILSLKKEKGKRKVWKLSKNSLPLSVKSIIIKHVFQLHRIDYWYIFCYTHMQYKHTNMGTVKWAVLKCKGHKNPSLLEIESSNWNVSFLLYFINYCTDIFSWIQAFLMWFT